MAQCPECGCDLPGTETLCRECFARHYAELSSRKKGFWRGVRSQSVLVVMVGILMSVYVLTAFMPTALSRFLDPISTFVFKASAALLLAVKLIMCACAITLGIWDSWKWR